jgi:membrane protease YdiL (CAAX protease family)
MKSFFRYIKNPISLDIRERFTLNIYLKTIGLSYLLFFLASVFLASLKMAGLLPVYHTPKVISPLIFFAVIVFVPLLEEIFFRLNLEISKLNIAVFLSLLITVVVKITLLREIPIYRFLVAIPVFVLIFFIIDRANPPIQSIETFWKSHFKFIFHFAAIGFGMMHLFNFETIKWWMVAVSPLLVAPYITMGYIFGYIRMKHGFIYGWLIHATVNFVSVLLAVHKGIIVVLVLTGALIAINYFIQKEKKKQFDLNNF